MSICAVISKISLFTCYLAPSTSGVTKLNELGSQLVNNVLSYLPLV